MGKGAWDYLAPCPKALWKLPAMGTPPCSWGAYSSDWSHFSKFIPYINTKPLLVQCAPVAPCLLHVGPCEERASVLVVAALKALERCDVPRAFSSPGRKDPTLLQSFLMGQIIQLFCSSSWNFLGPSPVFLHIFWNLQTRIGDITPGCPSSLHSG